MIQYCISSTEKPPGSRPEGSDHVVWILVPLKQSKQRKQFLSTEYLLHQGELIMQHRGKRELTWSNCCILGADVNLSILCFGPKFIREPHAKPFRDILNDAH